MNMINAYVGNGDALNKKNGKPLLPTIQLVPQSAGLQTLPHFTREGPLPQFIIHFDLSLPFQNSCIHPRGLWYIANYVLVEMCVCVGDVAHGFLLLYPSTPPPSMSVVLFIHDKAIPT